MEKIIIRNILDRIGETIEEIRKIANIRASKAEELFKNYEDFKQMIKEIIEKDAKYSRYLASREKKMFLYGRIVGNLEVIIALLRRRKDESRVLY